MNNSERITDSKNSTPKLKRILTGINADDYKKCEKWNPRRWAWAFLCRNPDFIRESDEVQNGADAAKKKVARKYGLVSFKYYGQVQTKKDGFPTFKDGAIKTWANFTEETEEYSISLGTGQVLVRFKLQTEVNAEQSLNAQIEKARKILHKKRDELEKQIKKVIGKKAPNSTSFIEYLRILDMQAHGIKDAKEITIKLFGIGDPETEANIDDKVRHTRRKIAAANQYAKVLYRYIALAPTKKISK